MFEHLDDPRPPEPTEAHRRAVVRSAAGLRRDRRLTVGVGALMLAVGLVAGVVVAGAPGPVPLSVAQSAFLFNQQAGRLPVDSPVPTTALAEVIFVTPDDGFGVAVHRDRPLLAGTTDAGDTWRVVDAVLPPGFATGGGFDGQFEFTNLADGYLWGEAPSARGAAPLWATADGGRTWRAAAPGPVVADVSAIGADVWALTTDCPAPGGAGCTAGLSVSLDAGRTWQPSLAPALVPSAGAAGHTVDLELARITALHAFVLTRTTPATTMSLAYTADGGVSWATRPVPCTGLFDLGAELAASSTDDLWLLCGSQGTAGSQPKELFRSDDGGQQWLLASSASGFFGTPADPSDSPDPLPSAGYTAPLSIGHKNLAVVSATTAWLFPSRGLVSVTTDGGVSWTPVPDLEPVGLDAGGAGNITFVSATDGWVCELGVGLWHTVDGVHWSALGEGP